MDWSEKELKKIKAVVEHLNAIICVTNGTSIKLDTEAEQVHFYSESGKKYKTISISAAIPTFAVSQLSSAPSA